MGYDTIVVGMGAAGMTAAATLAKAGRRVLGLEADDRIGGRVKTVPFGDGVVEVGAEWIHGSSHNRIYELATENNIPIVEQDFKSGVYMSDGSLTDAELMNELMDYCYACSEDPPVTPMPLGKSIAERFTEYTQKKYPDLAKDEEFMREFLAMNNCIMSGYLALSDWDDSTSHSSYAPLDGHQHLSWHKHGYNTLFQILLNKYNNGAGLPSLNIKLHKEVMQIQWPKDSSGDVEVVCKDGERFTTDTVIVTVSLGVLKERHTHMFLPSLPKEKVDLINSMSIGVLGKIILEFETPWWNDSPFTSLIFMWRSEDRKKVSEEDLWVTKIFGCSVPIGSKNAFTVWTSGDVAKLVETLPEEVVTKKTMELLRRFMGKQFSIPEPKRTLITKWHSNPYTRGSYTYDNLLTPQQPNARTILGEPLLDAFGRARVLFAGEATNQTHFSTVHGASETGYREAMKTLNASYYKMVSQC
ncbi:spermine oxidase-like isoform X2 [Aricia agestis]|nr:spermine oxidase-like isoform X2 [Aricia agestis]XP_041983707.1 spermine oxidase-like isoform X2 [Aricia agestis]XP_041983708.1 spermine oxidase-like isoform X2 [Aricia agestis]